MAQSDDPGKRALALVEDALHSSITVSRLLSTAADGGYVFDDPPIDRLRDGEQPHFAYYNRLKGISVGSRWGSMRPDVDGGTLILITDERILTLIGREDGDLEFSLPYESVKECWYNDGRLKKRILIETDEDRYHLWISPKVGITSIEKGAAYVAEKIDELEE